MVSQVELEKFLCLVYLRGALRMKDTTVEDFFWLEKYGSSFFRRLMSR